MYLHYSLLLFLIMSVARRLVLVPLRSSRPRRRLTRLRRSTTLRGLRRYATAPAPSALRRLDLGAIAPRPSAAQ